MIFLLSVNEFSQIIKRDFFAIQLEDDIYFPFRIENRASIEKKLKLYYKQNLLLARDTANIEF